MNEVTADRAQVREYLSQLLVEIAKTPIDRIVDAATLDADLKMESVALIEIQVALEERFDIEVDPIEVLELNEFGAIVEYVCDRIRRRLLRKAKSHR